MNRKKIFCIAVMALPLAAQSQKKPDSFWEKLLKFAGIAATPASLRGREQAASGDVWLATVAQRPVLRRLTQGGGYYSPVFDFESRNVLALKGGDLYRISVSGNAPARLYAVAAVTKLVGASRDDADQLLVLGKDSERLPFAATLSLRTGMLTRIPHNPSSNDDQLMLANLAGWERVYGDTRVYVEKDEKEGAGGSSIEFSDVYVKRANDPPLNLTNGNGISSTQPSLSADGRLVVFIRSAQ